MKIKKILSVVLVAAMLFSALCINVSADEGITYEESALKSYNYSSAITFNPKLFGYSISADESKIAALDGESTAHELVVTEISAYCTKSPYNYNYLSEDEAERAAFEEMFTELARTKEIKDAIKNGDLPEDYKDEDAAERQFYGVENVSITVKYKAVFESTKAFGDLDMVVKVDGFSLPPSTGNSLIDGFIEGVPIPTTLEFTPSVDTKNKDFPYVSSVTVNTMPTKDKYTDAEYFDLEGVSVNATLSNGEAGTITYGGNATNMFTTVPSKNEKLTTDVTSVATFIAGYKISALPVQVSHQWSEGYVNITTNKVSASNTGYHAIVCEGCGETKDAQPHSFPNLYPDTEAGEVDEWTYNEDATFLRNGTKSCVCPDCGTVLVADAPNTAQYLTALGDYHFIVVILDYVSVLLSIINSAVN
ncbi:MAG: hypothetical protein ACI4IF_03120 [Acutalibacteraceae bacterium]